MEIRRVGSKEGIFLPNFAITEDFRINCDHKLNQWEYLKHLTKKDIWKHNGKVNETTRFRMDFEFFTIKSMSFARNFLILMDFINVANDLA